MAHIIRMCGKAAFRAGIAVFPLLFFVFPTPGHAQPSNTVLTDLEQTAASLMKDGHPVNALEIYHNYERVMVLKHWDRLQIDVLHNKAVASYRAGKLAEAMAYAKQLYVIAPSQEHATLVRELEMLIEHKIYQEYPATTFQRGQASNYALWESMHRYSEAQFRIDLILSWSSMFVFMIAGYLLRKYKRLHIFFTCAVAICTLFTIIMVVFNILQYTTGKTQFGVIENNLALRAEADFDSKILPANEFTPGMTVEILATIPGWVKVMRIDGKTAWINAEDLYLLRGLGDQHPAHLVKPSKGRHAPKHK